VWSRRHSSFFPSPEGIWDSRLLLALCKSISTGAGHS
jgi:hypothetical protein